MLFSAFALAVDGFVTIGRRTAQFFFCLLMVCLFLGSPRPPRLLTHATRRALCTLAGDLGTDLVSAIETENLKNLKTPVHIVNCIVNGKPQKPQKSQTHCQRD